MILQQPVKGTPARPSVSPPPYPTPPTTLQKKPAPAFGPPGAGGPLPSEPKTALPPPGAPPGRPYQRFSLGKSIPPGALPRLRRPPREPRPKRPAPTALPDTDRGAANAVPGCARHGVCLPPCGHPTPDPRPPTPTPASPRSRSAAAFPQPVAAPRPPPYSPPPRPHIPSRAEGGDCTGSTTLQPARHPTRPRIPPPARDLYKNPACGARPKNATLQTRLLGGRTATSDNVSYRPDRRSPQNVLCLAS